MAHSRARSYLHCSRVIRVPRWAMGPQPPMAQWGLNLPGPLAKIIATMKVQSPKYSSYILREKTSVNGGSEVFNTSLPSFLIIHSIMSRVRHRYKNIFLTYSQCDLPKELVLEAILYILTPTNVLIAQEKHQEGGFHLHLVVLMDEPVNCSNPSIFDILNHHPNVQPCRNVPKSLKYLTKEDPSPLAWPEDWNWMDLITAQTSKKSLQSIEVANLIQSGSTLSQVNQTHPGFLMMNLPKIQAYQAFIQNVNTNQTGEWKAPCLSLDPTTNQISLWLASNIKKERSNRQKHLWLWGPTQTGKSHLCIELDKMLDTYWFPHSEDFHNLYSDNKQLIVMDDFHAWIPVNTLIKWTCGTPLQLKTKGGQMVKKKHIPVIITSNSSPDEMYWRCKNDHPLVFDALLARFEIVHVRKQIDVQFI